MSEEFIYSEAENPNSKKSPSFQTHSYQRNFKKSLILKEKNQNHYLLNLTNKLETNSQSIIDKINFYLSYIKNNKCLPNSLLKKNADELALNLKREIISVDFDKENNMLLILRKIGDNYFLHVKELLDNSFIEYRILTKEKILLNAKFCAGGYFDKIVVIGLNRIYFISLIQDNEIINNRNTTLDINLNPFEKEDSNLINNFANNVNKTEKNENFTDITFTLGDCYYIYWSKVSKKIKILRKATEEIMYYNLNHIIDKVEISKYNQMAVFYLSSGEIEEITAIDFDTKTIDNIDISDKILKNKYSYGNIKMGVNKKLSIKIGGNYDQIFISKKSIFFLYENIRYQADMFKKIVHPMKYELKLVFPITDIFGSRHRFGKNSFFEIETSYDNFIWFHTFQKKGNLLIFNHAQFDYILSNPTDIIESYEKRIGLENVVDVEILSKFGKYHNFRTGFNVNKYNIIMMNKNYIKDEIVLETENFYYFYDDVLNR